MRDLLWISRSALTSSGAAALCNGTYCSSCMYVCMYVNVFIMVVVNRYLSIHTYRRALHCDEEIDVGERDDKRWIEDGTASLYGGYTTMYVCKLVNGKV
jgi:hypothetical protein